MRPSRSVPRPQVRYSGPTKQKVRSYLLEDLQSTLEQRVGLHELFLGQEARGLAEDFLGLVHSKHLGVVAPAMSSGLPSRSSLYKDNAKIKINIMKGERGQGGKGEGEGQGDVHIVKPVRWQGRGTRAAPDSVA